MQWMCFYRNFLIYRREIGFLVWKGCLFSGEKSSVVKKGRKEIANRKKQQKEKEKKKTDLKHALTVF